MFPFMSDQFKAAFIAGFCIVVLMFLSYGRSADGQRRRRHLKKQSS